MVNEKQTAQTVPRGVPKWSLILAGRKTSVTLEEPFWQALREIATERGLSVAALINSIGLERDQPNRSSALRLFVLEYFRARHKAPKP